MQKLKEKILKFIDKHHDWIVCIVWPTASWKTSLSLNLIRDGLQAEIISADSRQIFKYMNIGTDKVSPQIQSEIPHHLIDIVQPNEFFTAWDWNILAKSKIQEIQSKNKIPFVVWWTGLYVDTLYKNYTLPQAEPDPIFREKLYKQENQNPWFLHEQLSKIDPQSAAEIHPNSTRYIVRALEIFHKTWKAKSVICKQQPVDFPIFMIVKRADKEIANPKIDKRIQQMIQEWLIQEIQEILKMWFTAQDQWFWSIWYKEFLPFLSWECDLETAIANLRQNTYRYAKKQRTFFRRYINDSSTPKKNVYFEIL